MKQAAWVLLEETDEGTFVLFAYTTREAAVAEADTRAAEVAEETGLSVEKDSTHSAGWSLTTRSVGDLVWRVESTLLLWE